MRGKSFPGVIFSLAVRTTYSIINHYFLPSFSVHEARGKIVSGMPCRKYSSWYWVYLKTFFSHCTTDFLVFLLHHIWFRLRTVRVYQWNLDKYWFGTDLKTARKICQTKDCNMRHANSIIYSVPCKVCPITCALGWFCVSKLFMFQHCSGRYVVH